MPNWCNNNITIEGPIGKIDKLYRAATAEGDDAGLLNAMVPRPAELNDTTAPSADSEERQAELFQKYGANNWYDWSVSRWGTKWDVSPEGLEFIDNGEGRAMITGWFESAWSPPIGAYETFAEENPDCSISASYHEPGMDFAGFWINGEDEYCEDLHGEYKLPEDEQSDLFKRLDEEYGLSEQFAEWEEMEDE